LGTVFYVAGGLVAGVRSAAGIVVEPFSYAINSVARPIGHFFAGAVNYSDVVAQNQRLRYELGEAEMNASLGWGESRQLTEMQTALNVPFVGTIPTELSQVTSLSPTNFAATFDIDRGRDDGVLAGMPVVANGGLVGSIISTTPHGATVRLITDVESSVGVTTGTNAPSIVISGQGVNNGLAASQVALTTQMQPGAVLTTDGLSGGLYPMGIPVATVSSLTLSPGSTDYNLKVHPTADLRHLTYVDVVLWEPGT
jgi:rod shape-determining protein MreC